MVFYVYNVSMLRERQTDRDDVSDFFRSMIGLNTPCSSLWHAPGNNDNSKIDRSVEHLKGCLEDVLNVCT